MSMRPQQFTMTLVAPSTSNICASQTPAGAGNLTINGTLASGGAVSLSDGYLVSITSASNISARTFTVTGTDADGQAQTSTITGPNATTVYGTKYFKTISSISVDAATGAALTVGTDDAAVSKTYPTSNAYMGSEVIGLMVDVTGTVNYTLQYTMQDVQNGAQPSTLTWISHDYIAAQTADVGGNITVPVRAIRMKINSYSSGAIVVTDVLHQG